MPGKSAMLKGMTYTSSDSSFSHASLAGDAAAEKLYAIAELAAELGITPRAIRFYEAKGLLKPQRVGTTRVYSRRDRARMILILRGKRLGFSLREIKEYLDLYVLDTTQAEQIHHLIKKIHERMSKLEEQRKALDMTMTELKEIERQALEALRSKGLAPKPA